MLVRFQFQYDRYGYYTSWSRAYVSGAPRNGVTADYFWDMPYQSTVLALLDPIYLRNYILDTLRSGALDTAYEINYMTGEGEGRRYAFNELSIFTAIMDYIRVTSDTSFLWESLVQDMSNYHGNIRISSVHNDTVLCALHRLVTHYQKLPQIHGLADYGGNMNLLECVPQYSHAVPALNGANIWMQLELARLDKLLLAKLGNHTESMVCIDEQTPGRLQDDAEAIAQALLPNYVSGVGYWRSLHNDSTTAEVRTIIDFHTLGSLIGAPARANPDPWHFAGAGYLSEMHRDQMAAFVDRELVTPDWMRALSVHDTFANMSAFRPDHGVIGSFDGWPAQAIDALLTMEKPAQALKILRQIATGGVVREGPLGQAHTLLSQIDGNKSHGGLFGHRRLCNNTSVPTEHCKAWKSEVCMKSCFKNARLLSLTQC